MLERDDRLMKALKHLVVAQVMRDVGESNKNAKGQARRYCTCSLFRWPWKAMAGMQDVLPSSPMVTIGATVTLPPPFTPATVLTPLVRLLFRGAVAVVDALKSTRCGRVAVATHPGVAFTVWCSLHGVLTLCSVGGKDDFFAEESGLNCAGNDGLVDVGDDDLLAILLGLFEGFGQNTVEDREVSLVVDKLPSIVAAVWCCTSVGVAEGVFVPLEETIDQLCVRRPIVGVEDNALFISNVLDVVLDCAIRDGTICNLDVKLESESQRAFFFLSHVGDHYASEGALHVWHARARWRGVKGREVDVKQRF